MKTSLARRHFCVLASQEEFGSDRRCQLLIGYWGGQAHLPPDRCEQVGTKRCRQKARAECAQIYRYLVYLWYFVAVIQTSILRGLRWSILRAQRKPCSQGAATGLLPSLVGLWSGLIIDCVTEYYTSFRYQPDRVLHFFPLSGSAYRALHFLQLSVSAWHC